MLKSFITITILTISSQLFSQILGYSECLNDSDAFIGLDRKGWTSNVDEVSESYQIDFPIPTESPFPCSELDRIEVSVDFSTDDNNIDPPGCFLGFWTHVLDCDSNDPIGCDAGNPFYDSPGLPAGTIIIPGGDVEEGATLAVDVVVLTLPDDPMCPQTPITLGQYSGSYEACVDIYYRTVFSEEELDLGDDIIVCQGETASLLAPDGFEGYSWSGEIETEDQDIFDAPVGDYVLTVVDDNGCTLTDDIAITVSSENDVIFNLNNPFTDCTSNENLRVIVNGLENNPDFDYSWALPDMTNANSSEITLNMAGTYLVTVTDNDDCDIVESFTFSPQNLSPAQINEFPTDTIRLCEGDSTRLTAYIPSTDLNEYATEWTFNTMAFSLMDSIVVASPGQYILNMFNTIGCPPSSDTIIIETLVPFSAGNDGIIASCPDVELNLNTYLNGFDGMNSQWYDGNMNNIPNPSAYFMSQNENGNTFLFVAINDMPCQNDSAFFEIQLTTSAVNAGDDAIIDLCFEESIDLNQLTNGDNGGMFFDNNFDLLNSSIINSQNAAIGQSMYYYIINQSCGSDSALLTVTLFDENQISEENYLFCEGESIMVHGQMIDSPLNNEMINLIDENMCDSMIIVNADFYAPSEFTLVGTFCEGNSIMVGSEVISQTIMNEAIILENASTNGCDSTVFLNVTFQPAIDTLIDDSYCADQSVTIEGNIYDSTNNQDTITLIGGSSLGCDSIIYIDLTFNDAITETLTGVYCEGEEIVINGETFDINNTSAMQDLMSINGCDSILDINLTFFENTGSVESVDLCLGDSIFINQEWITNEGVYFDTLLNSNACDSIIETQLSFMICNTDISIISLEDIQCAGSADGLIEIDVTSFINTGFNYTLNNSETGDLLSEGSITSANLIFTDFDEGMYLFEISDQNIVLASLSFSFTNPLLLDVSSEINNVNCNGGNTGNITIDVQGGTAPYDISWSNGSDEFVLNNLESGELSFIITDDAGCTFTNTINIIEPEEIDAIVQVQNVECDNSTNGSIQLSDVSGGTPDYLFSINDTDDFSNQSTFENLSPGGYIVYIQDDNGCLAEFNSTVEVEGDLTVDTETNFTINEGETVSINLVPNFTPLTIEWSPDNSISCLDCLNPVLSPEANTTYIVTLTNDEGCVITRNITVQVFEIIEEINVYIPNAFSPNSVDGNNIFKPLFNNLNVEVVNLQIYDRWGNKVFEENGSANGWDGRINDRLAIQGVYVYAINMIINGIEEQREGTITLLH